MASEIKAIKCPQCGSTQQTEIRRNYFRCNSCGTEYFVNNENDITITHKYDIPNNTPQLKKAGIIIVSVIGAIIVLSFISSLLFSGHKKMNSYHTLSTSPAPSKEKPFKWYRAEDFYFESAAGQPIFIALGIAEDDERRSADAKNVLAGFYDAVSGKEIKKQELNIPLKVGFDIKFRMFESGDLYCIVDEKRLLKVDRQYIKIEEVSPDLYKDIPDFSSGLAQIKFVYEGGGDGFQVLTNDGKERYYYPLIQKVYTKDLFYKARSGFSTVPSDTPVQTAFAFSRNDEDDYPEEKIQLVKYQYKCPSGYPKDTPAFGWRKDYGGSGFFTDKSPYKKSFITRWSINQARVVSYTDFTPGRLYFDSKVLASDEHTVLIAFRSSVAQDAPYSIQALDAKTARILWTTPIDSNLYIYDGFISDSGYCINANVCMLFIDKTGKIVNQFKL